MLGIPHAIALVMKTKLTGTQKEFLAVLGFLLARGAASVEAIASDTKISTFGVGYHLERMLAAKMVSFSRHSQLWTVCDALEPLLSH